MDRGNDDFKNDYLLGSDKVNNEKGDLVTGFLNILVKWRNDFYHLWNHLVIMTLGTKKYVQQSHKCLIPTHLDLRWLLKRKKDTKSPDTDQIST